MTTYIIVKSKVVDGKRICSFEQELDDLSEAETFKIIVGQEFSKLSPLHADPSLGTLYFLAEEIDNSEHANPFMSNHHGRAVTLLR